MSADLHIVRAAVAWENSHRGGGHGSSLSPRKFRRAYREQHGQDIDTATVNAIREECVRIRELRRQRELARWVPKPLPTEQRLRVLRVKRELAAELRAERQIRHSLKCAARAARSLGAKVRSSKHGRRVSSYYCQLPGQLVVRISDHSIPVTEGRIAQHGDGYNGFTGPQLLVDGSERELYIRRAVALLLNGRSVPATT